MKIQDKNVKAKQEVLIYSVKDRSCVGFYVLKIYFRRDKRLIVWRSYNNILLMGSIYTEQHVTKKIKY